MATRTEIREAVVALLKDSTDALDRVSSSRARRVWTEGLPAIVVYTPREEFEESIQSPREYRVRTDVVVEIIVEGSAESVPDELLDTVSDQVWEILTRTPTLCLDNLELEPVSNGTTFEANAKKPLASERFTWRATHYREAPEGEPGEPGLFQKLHAEQDLAPTDGDLEAIDDVTLEQ